MVRNQIPSQETQGPISYEIGLKLRDLEESHKLMKERTILIGQNMINFQEKTNSEITLLKKDVYEIKSDMKRIKEIIESLSEEISKSARKEELAILSRQFKMFEPLRFARIIDVEKIVDEKLHHKHHESQAEENNQNNSAHEFWRNKI